MGEEDVVSSKAGIGLRKGSMRESLQGQWRQGEGASGQRRRRGERAGSEGGAGVGQDRASPRGADCSRL